MLIQRQVKRVLLKDLVLDERLQMRVEMSEEHVDDLVEAIEQKASIPRIKIREVKGVLYVVDGFHTVKAHLKSGSKHVDAEIRPGTWQDAVRDAAGANSEHKGLKRSNKDKRKAVTEALKAFPKESDREIADITNTSQSLVLRIRNEVKAAKKNPPPVSEVPPSKDSVQDVAVNICHDERVAISPSPGEFKIPNQNGDDSSESPQNVPEPESAEAIIPPSETPSNSFLSEQETVASPEPEPTAEEVAGLHRWADGLVDLMNVLPLRFDDAIRPLIESIWKKCDELSGETNGQV